MLISVILTKQRSEKVIEAAKELGEIILEQVGTLDSQGIKDVLNSAARVASDILILDLDIGSGRDIVAALQSFRIARPHTRIIILAPAREPGDVIVSSLVGLGIYDIISGSKDSDWGKLVKDALARQPATYAQAARWHTGQFLGIPPVKEQVIIEERPSGVVTIAVAGTAHGLGCTYTALSIAYFLARLGHSAAIIEDSQRPSLGFLCSVLKARSGRVQGSFMIHGLDIFPLDESATDVNSNYDILLKKIRAGQYEYIVRDIGVLDPVRVKEIYKADFAFIVASAAKWRWQELIDKIDSEFSIIFPLASQNDIEDLSFYAGIKGTALPHCPNPFSKDNDLLFLKLLAPILPNRKRKKSLFGL
ncbi:hypothetical protein [Thermosediminibacter oceani]|uniref:Uncharacterized protein n=1 Tax=Thermosediminibacter oceani (strain ATCC BAA-1034 / DSM 16646 / JW/IW-1228P) TaxID=555079 RepID=D9S1D7_THEOJ|nr:hypothetical protein [Thermosediminibacter oceani]ADL07214.1 hypothetical protein Toce_0436 [Thermosediminibacter oceani DSM 16646]